METRVERTTDTVIESRIVQLAYHAGSKLASVLELYLEFLESDDSTQKGGKNIVLDKL